MLIYMNQDRKKELNFKFWEVKNKEEARYVIKQCSYAFLFVAGLDILLGTLIDFTAIIDGIVYLILGLLLFRFNSRVVSILLLLISGLSVASTFLNAAGITYGGRNMLLAILVFYCAIAAVYTTFKYRKLA